MTELANCPKCGQPLSAHAPAGLCPKCLIRAGLESELEPLGQPAATIPSPSNSRFEPLSVESLAGKFPQLEILELLGKGGMGAVYKARQRGLDRLVAVKVLPPEIGHDPAFAERFTREARALARLSHNHIVSVFDFGQSDGLFYIVMEYVDGVNLRQTIQTGKLTPAEALAIVPQICEALQFAHDEGIVHRDIKPENILIDKRGRVKIADFGLAKLLGQDAGDQFLTATHQVMGTLRYMAPEQMLGTREVDHRADIYSLGVIFYELLTGDLPMGKFAPPSKRVQIDVRLDEIVLRALEQQPEQRYQHASDIKTDMDAISRSPKSLVGTLGQARDEWWAARGVANPKAVSDGLVFRRLSIFNLLFWLVWSALIAALQWGYLSDAKWYFQKELPHTYLSGAWGWVSLMFAFFFVYWWYLLAKLPETPRSLPDAWRTMQTPDRRAIRLWIPGAAFLAVWIGATVVTMSFYDDDVQSTTLTALIIAAPLMAVGSCWWVYRERAGELFRNSTLAIENARDSKKSSSGLNPGLPETHIRFLVSDTSDVARQAKFHFSTLGYHLLEEGPDALAFERGSKWAGLWAFDIRKLHTILTVRTVPAAGGGLWVSCNWSLRKLGSWVLPGDVAKLEAEGRGLEALLAPKIETAHVVSPPAAALPAYPKLVPVLAVFNLVGAIILMLACAMETPAEVARPVPRLWQVWEQVDAVLGFSMAAGMFAASIGLFLWRPWARKLTLGVCIFGLASLVFDAPYLARFAIPDIYTDIEQTVIAEGFERDVRDFVTLATFLLVFGGLVAFGLACLIGQLIYFTRPRVVAAFESQGEKHGRFIEWLFTPAGAVVGVLSVFGPLALLLGIAALLNVGDGEATVEDPAAVPSLGIITSGIGVNFTVPAGQVAVFEIVTRRDNATVAIPNHCGYVMAAGKPLEASFLWSHSRRAVEVDGRKSWRIETRYAGGGGGSTEGFLLPEGLDAAVGSKSLGLGTLEPKTEIVSWCGNVDANKLPDTGLIGLRITVVPHGVNKSGSGEGHIDWKTQLPSSTTRRKLP